jgi:hypothetical protein
LAARAVDKVVLGPGEKLIALANASKASSSAALMFEGRLACSSGSL